MRQNGEEKNKKRIKMNKNDKDYRRLRIRETRREMRIGGERKQL